MIDPIRVGIIRCDTHGMWFGALMDEHDSVLLQRPVSFDESAEYSWHRGLIHYYYYSHYREPLKMTAPRVGGFKVTRIWDENRANAEIFARVFFNRPIICDRFEDVSDNVDLVLVADCNGDGSDHLQLARPGIEKGVPTFIDKPLAFSLADAIEIVRLGRAHNAPVLSLSILQTDPNTVRFARRIEEVGKLILGTVISPAYHLAGLMHAISVVHHVFGTGVRIVSALSIPRKHIAIHLDYGERSDRPSEGVVINCSPSDNPYPNPTKFSRAFAAAYGSESAIQGMVLDAFSAAEGAARILEIVKDMVHSRTVCPLMNDMVEAVAVGEAIRQAVESGTSVVVGQS